MIDFRGNKDNHISHMEFLTILLITLALKGLLRMLFMVEHANLLLDGLKFVNQG